MFQHSWVVIDWVTKLLFCVYIYILCKTKNSVIVIKTLFMKSCQILWQQASHKVWNNSFLMCYSRQHWQNWWNFHWWFDDDDGCGMAVITVAKYSVQLFQNNQCMALNVSEDGNIMIPPPPPHPTPLHTHTTQMIKLQLT